jgi:hypothetical protein
MQVKGLECATFSAYHRPSPFCPRNPSIEVDYSCCQCNNHKDIPAENIT